MALMGGAGLVLTNPIAVNVSNSAPGSGTSSAQFVINSDGTMTGTAIYSGPSNWISPTIAGIGAAYWVSIDGAAFQQLNTTRTTSINGANLDVTRTIRIATDSGGANIVSSGTIHLTVSNGV